MKSRIAKKTVSLLMAILMFVSVFAGSAYAEELLPEEVGAAIGSMEDTGTPTDPAGGIDTAEPEARTEDIDTPDTESTEAAPIEGDMGIAPPPAEEETAPDPEEFGADDSPETENPENTAPADTEADKTEPEADTADMTADETTAEIETTADDETTAEAEKSADDDTAAEAEKTAEDEIISCVIAGVNIEAKMVPHPHTREPEEDVLIDKNAKLTREIGDIIIKIGSGMLPFGSTIADFIRSRSISGKDMDAAETAIDMIADTASFMCPIAAPLVSIAKDIALKIRNLF